MNETETIPLAFHRAAEYVNGTASGNEHNAAYKILHRGSRRDHREERLPHQSGHRRSASGSRMASPWSRSISIPRCASARSLPAKATPSTGCRKQGSIDPDFGVVLAAPLKKGETTTFKITYGGKDVVLERGRWQLLSRGRAKTGFPTPTRALATTPPTTCSFMFPRAAAYRHGNQSERKQRRQNHHHRVEDRDAAARGRFQPGRFHSKETKIGTPLAGQLTIDAYANKERPDAIANLCEQLSDA